MLAITFRLENKKKFKQTLPSGQTAEFGHPTSMKTMRKRTFQKLDVTNDM